MLEIIMPHFLGLCKVVSCLLGLSKVVPCSFGLCKVVPRSRDHPMFHAMTTFF